MDEFDQIRREAENRMILDSKEELEQLRIQARNRVFISVFLVLGAMALVFFVFREMIALIFALFFGVVVGVLLTNKATQRYRKAFKQLYVRRSLETVFTELEYDPGQGISYDTIAATKMMHMGDRFRSEDYISARYREIGFEQSDVHIEEKRESRDSNGHRHTSYVTIFRGRWMIFDFNKEFRANLQIAQKGFQNATRKRFFGKKETLFKKVETESDAFNRAFRVYAQNEHDAFYIITPAFMERLQNLSARNKGKLMFCFVGDRLHIAIHDRKDSFEPGSFFKAIDEAKVMAKIRGEIETVTQFVDELNLDNNLFKWRD